MKLLSFLKIVFAGAAATYIAASSAAPALTQRLDPVQERYPEFSFPVSGDPRAVTLKLKLIDADCAPVITLLEGQSGTHTLTNADGVKRSVSFVVTQSQEKPGALSLLLIQHQKTEADGQIQNHFVTSLPALLELEQPLRLMTAGVESAELINLSAASVEMTKKCTRTCCVPCGGGITSCYTGPCGGCMTNACNGGGGCCVGGRPPLIRY